MSVRKVGGCEKANVVVQGLKYDKFENHNQTDSKLSEILLETASISKKD